MSLEGPAFHRETGRKLIYETSEHAVKFISRLHKIEEKEKLQIMELIVKHIDTLPKYSHKTLDVRRSTRRISSDECKFGLLKGSENDRCL